MRPLLPLLALSAVLVPLALPAASAACQLTPIAVFGPPVSPYVNGVYFAAGCYPAPYGGGNSTFTAEYRSASPTTAPLHSSTPVTVGPYPDVAILVCSDHVFGEDQCKIASTWAISWMCEIQLRQQGPYWLPNGDALVTRCDSH